MSTNVIDLRHLFLAPRRCKSEFKTERQLLSPSSIKLNPFPTVKCSQKQIRIFLDLFSERAIARSVIIDECGIIIAGEKYYRAMRDFVRMPAYVIAGLSEAQKTALRKAYATRGGDHD